ncbi:Pleiotropic regulator 1 [Trichoplax sp. H2]|nr:Pleiotropic regulator 1 [Trichoplax sp. H2]|eukprot:RDD42499.1 Pleiotropic regulator 1 [Trichoplax sp. H2]
METQQKFSAHTMIFRSLKRTHEMFMSDLMKPLPQDDISDESRMNFKVMDEYCNVKDLPPIKQAMTGIATSNDNGDPEIIATTERDTSQPIVTGGHPYPSAPGVQLSDNTMAKGKPISQAAKDQVYRSLPPSKDQLEVQKRGAGIADIKGKSNNSKAVAKIQPSSSQLIARKASSLPKPQWHPPWKLMRVISGHHGWVRAVAIEPGNDWFATGSGDRTIKIWDLASGRLKLSLTGHISVVRGLAVSPRHPYLFSVGEDKQVKCWDLECNKVIRHYHGHLSAVHAVDIHPSIDVLVTCGRDATARVWDMRTKAAIHTLTGHTNTVATVKCQAVDPQIITGSHDSTIRLWDLAAGRTLTTLTNHKKSIRTVALHPSQFAFASASSDNIKQWKLPNGEFMQNFSGHNAILNCLSINNDNVVVSGADNGTLHFWDWRTGYNFQKITTAVQPGSLDSEAGIYAMAFDKSGSRLITCEADKTIKIYKEDETATEETNPINWKPDIIKRRRY